jgi:dynactin complex subunit
MKCRHVGVVAYVGAVHYSQGEFIGVIMDEPVGKNNGLHTVT